MDYEPLFTIIEDDFLAHNGCDIPLNVFAQPLSLELVTLD